jgi:predicted XRE-type DNA-binding protein
MPKTHTAFDAIEKKPGEAASLRFRADLMFLLEDLIERRELSQKEMTKLLGEPKSRVSELYNGKFALFSAEKLIRYLAVLGYTFHPELTKRGSVKCKVERAA